MGPYHVQGQQVPDVTCTYRINSSGTAIPQDKRNKQMKTQNKRGMLKKAKKAKQPGLQIMTKDFQNQAAQQTSAEKAKCSNS